MEVLISTAIGRGFDKVFGVAALKDLLFYLVVKICKICLCLVWRGTTGETKMSAKNSLKK